MPLQSHLSLLLTYLLTTPSAAADPTPPSNAAVGVTIGGHLEGALICQGAPQTILNHTVSEGAIGGVLNYFWTTQAFRQKEVRPPACPLLPGPPAAAATAAAVAARARPAAVAWPAAARLFSTTHVCSRSTRRRACCACRTSRRSSRSGCAGPSYRHASPSHSHRQGPIAGL